MSKRQKAKIDFDYTSELLEIVSILRDVASNHFYNTAKRKQRFLEFANSFIDFFRMVNLSHAHHPLVHTTSPRVGILMITSEMGFMGEMTAKVIKTGYEESEKHPDCEFIIIGTRGEQKLKQYNVNQHVEVFRDIEEHGLYKVTLMVKEYITKQVLEGKLGKVIAIYPFAFNFTLIKPKVIKLLPSEELLTHQMEVKDTIEKVIVESDLNDIIGYLANLWLTCRIYEMLEDCVVAGFAAQAAQLEAAMERLKKDKKGLALAVKKAKKSDIDKSLKEVFTATLMMRK
ncbi:MAG: F0F1 ATP synthase subunit gamma [Candidatus Omnitrophota bacterium]